MAVPGSGASVKEIESPTKGSVLPSTSMTSLPNSALDPKKRVIAVGVESPGQVVDLTTQGRPFSGEQLQYIHASKTAALIETSVHCAALLADAEDTTVEQLRSFGSSVGLAFQIVDDILDVEGSVGELGKTSGKDAREQKATYPALYGVEESRKIVDELVENATSVIEFLGSRAEVLAELACLNSKNHFIEKVILLLIKILNTI